MALVVGEAILSGDTDVAANTTVAFTTAADLDGEVVLTANLLGIFEGRVDYQCGTLLGVIPGALRQAEIDLAGDAGLTLADVFFVLRSDVEGDVDLEAGAAAIYGAVVDLMGGVEITADPLLNYGGFAALEGGSTFEASATMALAGATSVEGDTLFEGDALDDDEVAADLFGGSEVSAAMAVSYEASYAFLGSTFITGQAVLRKPLATLPAAPTEVAPDLYPGLNLDREPSAVRHSWKIRT